MDVADPDSVAAGLHRGNRRARGPVTICVPNAGIAEGKASPRWTSPSGGG
jgi:hypothetical protein